jgi:O-antigen/teichoic acid export membrane protein
LLDPYLREYGKISTTWAFFPVSITIAGSAAIQFYSGFLQSLQHFVAMGAVLFLSALIVALTGGTAAIMDAGMFSIYSSEAIGRIGGLLLLYWLLRKALSGKSVKPQYLPEGLTSFALVTLLTTVVFFLMTTLDILSVKYYFSSEEAGYYLRIEFVGRLLFLVGSTIATILLPRVATNYYNGTSSRRFLAKSSLLFISFSTLCALGIFIFKETAFGIIFGKSFSPNTSIVFLLLFSRIAHAYLFILVNYFIGTSQLKFSLIIAAYTAIQTIFALMFHEHITQLALSSAICSACCAATLILAIIRFKQNNIPGKCQCNA